MISVGIDMGSSEFKLVWLNPYKNIIEYELSTPFLRDDEPPYLRYQLHEVDLTRDEIIIQLNNDSPRERSLNLLREMLSKTEQVLNAEIVHATVAYPSSYSTIQIESLNNLLHESGLKEVTLIPWSTSLCAYSTYERHIDKTDMYCVVCDFGASHTSIDVMQYLEQLGTYAIIESHRLEYGGNEFDIQVANELLRTDVAKHIDIDSATMLQVLSVIRTIKETGSYAGMSHELDSIIHDSNLLETESIYEKIHSQLASNVFPLLISIVEEAPRKFGIISKIILAGGGSKISTISEDLETNTQVAVSSTSNPSFAIAIGASLFIKSSATLKDATVMPENAIQIKISTTNNNPWFLYYIRRHDGIVVWDENGELLTILPVTMSNIHLGCTNVDRSFVALLSNGNKVAVVNTKTGRPTRTFDIKTTFSVCGLSGDGTIVAGYSNSRRLVVYSSGVATYMKGSFNSSIKQIVLSEIHGLIGILDDRGSVKLLNIFDGNTVYQKSVPPARIEWLEIDEETASLIGHARNRSVLLKKVE